MAGIKVTGFDGLKRDFDAMLVRAANQVRDIRAEIVEELVERLIENIPVWSGRTIASIWVDRTGAGEAVSQEHPQRGGYDLEGPWHPDERFGTTSQMPMGSEPMRGQAEAKARGQASKARKMTIWDASSVSITISSVPWGLIEKAQAPSQNMKSRNRAVVSEIAIAAVKAKFAGVLS